MTDYLSSPLGQLENQERLLSPVCKGPTRRNERFGFRGELAVKMAASTAGEKRPPEIKTDQVFMTTEGEHIVFYASYLDDIADLQALTEVLAPFLDAAGKYFIFAGNVDLLKKYRTELGGASFFVFPLDEGTVYNELLDALYLDRGDLKKSGMEEKLDVLTEAAAGYSGNLPTASFDQICAERGAIKVYENRPV